MVNVAQNVDAPIKLLFPKAWAQEDANAQFSMLGLGDVVIPGIFIALLLRFDATIAGYELKTMKDAKSLGEFNKPHFNLCMFFYCLGLFMTLFIMYAFEHAQPALLYLVPACLISSLISGYQQGHLKQLWNYSEEDEEEKKTKDEDKKEK